MRKSPSNAALAFSAGLGGRPAGAGGPGNHQGGGHPADGLVQLAGVDGGSEDVAHTRADRTLEQVGREVLGDENRTEVRSTSQQRLGTAEVPGASTRRPEDQEERRTAVALLDPHERLHRDRMFPELHRQAATDGRVGLNHQEGHVQFGG